MNSGSWRYSAGWTVAAFLTAVVLWPFYRGGIPGFSHDWVWSPVGAQTLSQWSLLFSAWNDTGLGSPNAVPTLNPLAWLKVLPAVVVPGGWSETVYLTASTLCAFAGVYALARRRFGLRATHAIVCSVLYGGSGFVLSKIASGQSSYWPASSAFIWACYFLLAPRGRAGTARSALLFALSTLMLQFTAFSVLTCILYGLTHRAAWSLRRAAIALAGSFAFAIPAITLLANAGPSRGADIPAPTPYWEESMSAHAADAASYFSYAGHYPERALLSLGKFSQTALVIQHWASLLIAVFTALFAFLLVLRLSRKKHVSEQGVFFALMALAGFTWMTGLNGPAGALWRYAFENADFAAFLREFFHAAILFALPASILPVVLATQLRGRLAVVSRAFTMLLAICAGLATWTGGLARLLPFLQAPPYLQAVSTLLRGEQGTVLYLPILQPLAVQNDVLGGNDIFDWAGSQIDSLFRYHVQTPVAYTLDRLRAGDTQAAKTMLERMSCRAVVVRPGITSRAAFDSHDPFLLTAELRRAFGEPIRLPDGALFFRVRGRPLASLASTADPFGGTFQELRNADVYIDRPGKPPSVARFQERANPRVGWTGYVNTISLPSPALASPQYGIVTLAQGASASVVVPSSSALLWAPRGIRVNGRLFVSRTLRRVRIPTGSAVVTALGPASIGETGAAAVRWPGNIRVNGRIVRERPWRYRGSATLNGTAIIVLRRSWDPAWRLEGAGIRVLDHARADGFGNAWLVEGHGAVSFTIDYAAQLQVEWLLAVSGALALAIVILGAAERGSQESVNANN